MKLHPISGCPIPVLCRRRLTSAYAGSEDLFRNVAPGTNAGTYLVTMMTASNLDLAKQLVNQGTLSDATFPTQTVWLAKSTDIFRNIRYQTFDNALFNTRLRDNYSVARTNSDSPHGQTNLLGYENGLYQFNILSNTFVPGAMADSLTSYGGIIFEPNDHTTLLSFLQAGASGAYGTVVEPCRIWKNFRTRRIISIRPAGSASRSATIGASRIPTRA